MFSDQPVLDERAPATLLIAWSSVVTIWSLSTWPGTTWTLAGVSINGVSVGSPWSRSTRQNPCATPTRRPTAGPRPHRPWRSQMLAKSAASRVRAGLALGRVTLGFTGSLRRGEPTQT